MEFPPIFPTKAQRLLGRGMQLVIRQADGGTLTLTKYFAQDYDPVTELPIGTHMPSSAATQGIVGSFTASEVQGGLATVGEVHITMLLAPLLPLVPEPGDYITDPNGVTYRVLSVTEIAAETIVALRCTKGTQGAAPPVPSVLAVGSIVPVLNGASFALPVPTGFIAENILLVAHVFSGGALSGTVPNFTAPDATWSLLATATQAGGLRQVLYYKIAGPDELGLTYTWTADRADNGAGVILALQEDNAQDAFDGALGTGTGTSGASINGASLTPTYLNDLSMLFYATRATGFTAAPPSNYTSVYAANASGQQLGLYIKPLISVVPTGTLVLAGFTGLTEWTTLTALARAGAGDYKY